jgi:hypothetical protein
MRKPGNIVGLAAIDKAIKGIANVGANLNERVQDVAVAIIEHAAGDGNGDVSRALTLTQTVAKMRTLNQAYLIGFFRYFGNCNVNLNANDGKGKVSLVSRDAKGYRGFDPAGAAHNKWYDAFDAAGKRADWYAGPAPAEYQPLTIGDLSARMQQFVKRTRDLLDKQVDERGYNGPAVVLAEGDRIAVGNALQFIERISNTLARHEDMEQAAQAMAKAQAEAEKDEGVLAVIQQPQEKAVA